METTQIIALSIGSVAGLVAAFSLFGRGNQKIEEENQKKKKQLLENAKKAAASIREEILSHRQEIKELAQEENERMEEHIKRLEESLEVKKKQVQSRLDKNLNIEIALEEEKNEINNMKSEIEEEADQMVKVLSEKTGISKEDAVQSASQALSLEITGRHDKFIQSRVQVAEEDALKIAQDKLICALQKYSDESSVDRTSTAVIVKNERFKPALIGADGKNIDYFEEKIDVELIFNDYPKTITVGGYNVMKRQTAKEAVEILKKGQAPITPAKIDVALEEAEKRVKNMMRKAAVDACNKIGIKDPAEGLLHYIGRLHFRTSYGQNALKHCLEVGFFAGILAAEIGADVEVARIAGFFHDIGKAISEESDKGHDYLTKDILEEFNYPEEIVHAAWVHHEAQPAKTLEAKLVMAADALSASRPGARLESLERYLQRIRALEAAANSFPGIKKTFAVSAGREIRVIVKPEEIDDKTMVELAHGIADKIEKNLTYPGNVRVNVIRRRKWNAKAIHNDSRGKQTK